MLNLAQIKSAIGCLGKCCYSCKDTILAIGRGKETFPIAVCMQQVYVVWIYRALTWRDQISHIHASDMLKSLFGLINH